MLKVFFIFAVALAGCYAGAVPTSAATPPAQGVYCAETPRDIYPCLGNPTVVPRELSSKCDRKSSQATECDRMKCLFTHSSWMNGEKVNKTKVAEHFDQYAVDQPSWLPAVNHLKAACLGPMDLPAQGVYLNCAPIDVVHCILTSFIRYATPTQWRTSPECTYPRAFAAACPVCPAECFASAVPYGACNACLALPRSA